MMSQALILVDIKNDYFPGAAMELAGMKAATKNAAAVLKAAPKRYMRLEHMHGSGDVVTNEVTLLDPNAGGDWSIPFVAVLVMRDGKIAIDRTYANYTDWPGFAGAG
jgi:ketosteroid isomerase-like protein